MGSDGPVLEKHIVAEKERTAPDGLAPDATTVLATFRVLIIVLRRTLFFGKGELGRRVRFCKLFFLNRAVCFQAKVHK